MYNLEDNYFKMDDYQETDNDILDMWSEKINRPGRTFARGDKELSTLELNYLISDNPEKQREAAIEWITNMEPNEFQNRLLEGTLPEFERECITMNTPRPIERDTCHPYCLMTDREHELLISNQGYKNRYKLRYMNVDIFKINYYQEFADLSVNYEIK